VPRLPATQEKRKRAQFEQEGDPPIPEQRAVRRRMNDADGLAQIHPPDNEQIHHPARAIGHQDAPEGAQSSGGSSSSSPTLAPPLQPPQNADSSSAPPNAIKPPHQAVAPPRTDGGSSPTLTEVNPESGPITGGARIWLKGIDFPALFPLFARFGTAVVPTVSPLI